VKHVAFLLNINGNISPQEKFTIPNMGKRRNFKTDATIMINSQKVIACSKKVIIQ
jgi:hypothetical protein